MPPGDRLRNPAFRQQAQQIFVSETPQLPARVEPGREVEDFFVEKRVADFDRGVHGDAVAFGLQKMARQEDAGRDPNAAIKWRPAFGSLDGKSQLAPGMAVVHYLAH